MSDAVNPDQIETRLNAFRVQENLLELNFYEKNQFFEKSSFGKDVLVFAANELNFAGLDIFT